VNAIEFSEKSFNILHKVLGRRHKYEPWAPGDKIVLRKFQKEVVDKIMDLLKGQEVVSLEIFCAGGKTIIAATVCEAFLKSGKKIIFVSPKRDAFAHFEREFKRVLHSKGIDHDIVHVSSEPGKAFPINKQIYIVSHYDVVSPNSSDARKRAEAALRASAIVVIDEVHRIPEDTEEDTKVIGKVEPIIRDLAIRNGARVLTMTGTHFRMDEKDPFGKPEPDIRKTCQDLIMERCLPNLYGFSVAIELDLKPGEIRKGTDVIRLKLSSRKKLTKYLDHVSNVVMQAIEFEDRFMGSLPLPKPRAPGGHAIFVSTQQEAKALCFILNRRLGRQAFCPYVSNPEISPAARGDIQKRLQSGDLLGYVTVMMGVESISIPRLKYCHLVARITSENKIMQAIGRVMRLPEAGDADCERIKDKAIVIDYQIKRKKIIELAKGIRDIAEIGGSKLGKVSLLGGPVFASPDNGAHDPMFEAKLADEYEAWLSRSEDEGPTVEEKKAWLVALAKSGAPRPKRGQGIKWDGLGPDGQPLDLNWRKSS
jgi:superfamily II DNA or RNA helicase